MLEIREEELNMVNGGENIPHSGQDENIPHDVSRSEDFEHKRKP